MGELQRSAEVGRLATTTAAARNVWQLGRQRMLRRNWRKKARMLMNHLFFHTAHLLAFAS